MEVYEVECQKESRALSESGTKKSLNAGSGQSLDGQDPAGVTPRERELARRVRELEKELGALRDDIAAKQEVEAALRESESKYRTLVENINIGVFRNTVGQGHIVQTNPAMARIFGYDSVEEFCNVSVVDLYQDVVDRQKFLEEMQANGFVRDRLIAMRKRDGTPIWCSVTAVAHYDRDGNLEFSDGVLEDVTEQKRLEAQLRHSQKMEAIGTLTGGIAHDFNNMLTAILGYANLLQLKMGDDPTLAGYVEQILASSEKAASLTSSLLAFSRKQIITPRAMDLNEIVAGVEKLLIRVIGEDIEFMTKVWPEELVVMADGNQLDQILLNLATNARDAMPDGGILTIETSRIRFNGSYGGEDDSLALEPGDYAVIAVADTGSGMEEETRQRIFEPFYTTKEVGRGTGLGLSMVYGIVRQHRGDIHVYSEPGTGTTFKIYLPLLENGIHGGRTTDGEVPGGGTETILVAEDDPDVRNLMCTMLSQFGYTVIDALDGEDAVAKFTDNRERIDLLLLDVVMPRLNGKECLDRIRAMGGRMPVIFASGYTADIIHAKGIHEDGAGFLQKPVQPRALMTQVRHMLDEKR